MYFYQTIFTRSIDKETIGRLQTNYTLSHQGPINRSLRALARVAKEVKFHFQLLT